jgi:TPR repeat protein
LGCNNLGAFHRDGKGVKQDHARALELFTRACDGDEAIGCANLAHAHQEGHGVAKNAEQAAAFSAKACKLGRTESCEKAGQPSPD